jgi:parallel beta-helix repeat protein
MRWRMLIAIFAIALLLAWPHAATANVSSSADDQIRALAELCNNRVNQLGRLAANAPEGMPFRRVDGSTGYAGIILPRRDTPYRIPELAKQFPDSFEVMAPGVYLLKDDLVIGRNATLLIEGREVHELRLLSTPDRFITVAALRGTTRIVGTPYQRVTVTSWDPATAGPDTTEPNGRAWVEVRRGSMSITWADLTWLGFETGAVSGVAWEGRGGIPAGGDVSYSTFQHNHFGVYTFEAKRMTWRYNTFAYNTGYGFDPHDHSDYFVVEYNRAFNNGTHGIIFSRGCAHNTIRFNESFNNGAHGIVLDDGPNLNPDGTLRERAGIPSNYNVIAQNVVYGNQIGIVLDGGTGNLISNNIVRNNEYGIRMKDAVEANTVSGNRFTDNNKFGIYLYNGSDRNVIASNAVSGGTSGIVIRDSKDNQITANTLRAIPGHGIDLEGVIADTLVSGNTATDVRTAIDLPDGGDPAAVTLQGNTFNEQNIDSRLSIRAPARRWIFWVALLASPVLFAPWWGRLRNGLRSGRSFATRSR